MEVKLFDFDKYWTPFHNAMIDVVMPALPPNAWKALCCIWRNTRKGEKQIGRRKLCRLTGIGSLETMSNSLADLRDFTYGGVKIPLILERRSDDKFEPVAYSLNLGAIIKWVPPEDAFHSPDTKTVSVPDTKTVSVPDTISVSINRNNKKQEKKEEEEVCVSPVPSFHAHTHTDNFQPVFDSVKPVGTNAHLGPDWDKISAHPNIQLYREMSANSSLSAFQSEQIANLENLDRWRAVLSYAKCNNYKMAKIGTLLKIYQEWSVKGWGNGSGRRDSSTPTPLKKQACPTCGTIGGNGAIQVTKDGKLRFADCPDCTK